MLQSLTFYSVHQYYSPGVDSCVIFLRNDCAISTLLYFVPAPVHYDFRSRVVICFTKSFTKSLTILQIKSAHELCMLLKITLISNIEIILNDPPYNCDENIIFFIILMNLYLIFYFNIPVDY